jgi:predicted dehydrogenase
VNKIKVGVIGAGILGSLHARVFHEMDDVELVAVADNDASRGTKIGQLYNCDVFTDYNAILDNPEIDAVSVAVPDHVHRKPVIDSLNKGKHVLMEKPLAVNLEDAEAMVEVQRRSGKNLMVNYNNRMALPYANMKAVIDNGSIGIPQQIYAKKLLTIDTPTKDLSWSASTSPIHFASTHDIDMICWFLNYPEVKEVYAVGSKKILKSKGYDTLDGFQAIVKFEGGVSATFESTWILPESCSSRVDGALQIIGDGGILYLDRKEEMVTYVDTIKTNAPRVAMGGIVNNRLQGIQRWSQEEFIASVRENRKPSIDGEMALRTVKICCAIEESIKEEKIVKF